MSIRVDLHRIAAGGSIRVTVNGGQPTYLTEAEVQERLESIPALPETVEQIVANLTTERGEHALNFPGRSPETEDFLREMWTGAATPSERTHR
jgi:hypothetical protein